MNSENINDFICIKSRRIIYQIRRADITHIVCETYICDVFLCNGEKIITTKLLKDFETELCNSYFVRIHHNTIVNTQHIKSIDNQKHIVTLNNNIVLKVSARKWILFKHYFEHNTY